MNAPRPSSIRFAALLTAAAALLTTGEIFWRRGPATTFEQDSSRLYATSATVNGKEGRLEVRAAPNGAEPMIAAAAAAAGRQAPGPRIGSAYQFVTLEGGALVHRFVLPPGMDGTAACLVFSREASGGASGPSWPGAMPRFAGGVPGFSAELGATRAALVTAETAASPAAVLEEAAAAYAADGWAEVTPVRTDGMRLFVKGRAQAAVQAEPGGSGTRVTAIQRLGSHPGF